MGSASPSRSSSTPCPRSRSRQSVVGSPGSTGPSASPPPPPPGSAEFEWSQVKPSLRSTKTSKAVSNGSSGKGGGGGGSGERKKPKSVGPSSQSQVLEYEMTQFDKRIALGKPGPDPAAGGPKDPQCKATGPLSAAHQQLLIQQQGAAEKRRNGIMTNPNYHLQGNQVFLGRVSVPRTLQDRGHQDVLEGYPIGETELSLKQALKLQIEGADPAFNYKKETPL
ncbi:hypothetical protein AAFF_G00266120 [Aldrovandia affinis]|uniref:Uncharacterized protein n=1 Tax=Aldrovandia affinis TaxID=143900 RepID=A0AAD7W2L0_9TELE|nr:hypothetical protein AAFF_G00266120 [Aldrovandia affinis]